MASQFDDRCWKLRPDVVATVLNDGAVLLDLQSKFFFSANASAWAIAEIFESGATRSSIHDACRRWGATADDAATIDAIIQQMMSEGLIQPVNQTAMSIPGSGIKSWTLPTLAKHREPLQRIMVSAFDPGLPLAE